MDSYSPWAASGLLSGTRQRLAAAGAAVAALWLAVFWASLGSVGPQATTNVGARGFVGTRQAAGSDRRFAPEPASALSVVVQAGTAAPSGGSFDAFGLENQPIAASINSRGDVAFFAKLMRGVSGEGLFLAHQGQLRRLAAAGDRVSTGGTLASFTERPAVSLNGSGTIAFAATLDGGSATDAVLVASSGKPTAVAQSGQRAPGISGGVFFDFGQAAINDAGDVAFLATVRKARETMDAIYVATKGELTKLAANGDPVPGGGVFAGLGAPSINGKGEVAFGAVTEQAALPGGIFVAGKSGLRRAVASGDTAPGGGLFARLSEHVGIDDDGRVGFVAMLSQSPIGSGVFVAGGSGVTQLAAERGSAPGGGKFVSFGDAAPLAPDGRLAFMAAVQGGPGTLGAFATGPGGLQRVSTVGDRLADGRRISDFPLNPVVAIGPGGRIALQAGVQGGEERSDAVLLFRPEAGIATR